MTEEESKLEKLKESYLEIQKKYLLPEFDNLNQEFSIEKVADIETDYLVREIRRFMADKFAGYLRFSETILNPSNAPQFVFSVVKTLKSEDKKKISDAYKELAKIEIKIIELDTNFIEEKEAEFVKNSFESWQSIKRNFLDVLETINKNWDSKFESNNKSYFG